MITARLVYLSEGGNGPEVTPQDYRFDDFYRDWANGSIKRDFEVKVLNKEFVDAALLEGVTGSKFGTLGAEILQVFLDLHDKLSLPRQLLANMTVHEGEVMKVNLEEPREVFWIGDHLCESVRSNSSVKDYFCSRYALYHALHSGGENSPKEYLYPKGPEELIYNLLHELFWRITNQDNINFLKMLDAALAHSKDRMIFKPPFSMACYSRLQTEIAKWHLPAHTCLITAKTLAEFPLNDLGGRYTGEVKVGSSDVFELMGSRVICLGSPSDFIYPFEDGAPSVYFCTSPDELGVQAVFSDFSVHEIPGAGPGQPRPNAWFYQAHKSMALVNPRGVVSAIGAG